MAYRTPWPQPYPGLSKIPPAQVHRITVETLRADTACIASVATNQGIFSLIIQSALKETAAYIREHSLTYADSEQLVDWICKRTFTRPATSPVGQNVTGPAPTVLGGTQNPGKVPTVPGKETPGGSVREGRGRVSGGGKRRNPVGGEAST